MMIRKQTTFLALAITLLLVSFARAEDTAETTPAKPAQKKSKKTEKTADENEDSYNLKFEKANAPAKKETSRPNSGGARFGVSGPLMIASGGTFVGANLVALGYASHNVLIGGEMGYFIWSKSSGGASATQHIIPILGTVMYRFDTESEGFSPLLGFSLGPAINNVNVRYAGMSGSGSEVEMAFFGRAGAIIGEKENFMGEMKLGSIDGTFVFQPSLTYFF